MPDCWLALSPLPDSDNGEGSVPEPPASKESAITDLPHLPSSNDGSVVVLLLTVAGGHPALSDFADRPNVPRQHHDMSLHKYGLSWQHYLGFLALCGTSLSDRYSIPMFFGQLPSCLCPTFEPYLLSQSNHLPLVTYLPPYLAPGRLIAHPPQFDSLCGLSHFLIDPPRPSSSGPAPLLSHALVHVLDTAAYNFYKAPGHLASACSCLAPLDSVPCCQQRLTWLLSASVVAAHQPGSGTPVCHLALSPSPASDNGEGYVPEPPDSGESASSSEHAQEFC